MPGFLLAGFMGSGVVGVVRLLFLLRSWIGSRSCLEFVGSIITASRAAARCFIWSSRIWSGGIPDSMSVTGCMAYLLLFIVETVVRVQNKIIAKYPKLCTLSRWYSNLASTSGRSGIALVRRNPRSICTSLRTGRLVRVCKRAIGGKTHNQRAHNESGDNINQSLSLKLEKWRRWRAATSSSPKGVRELNSFDMIELVSEPIIRSRGARRISRVIRHLQSTHAHASRPRERGIVVFELLACEDHGQCEDPEAEARAKS